jgi:hypothetical protein
MTQISDPTKTSMPSAEVMALFGDIEVWKPFQGYQTPRAARKEKGRLEALQAIEMDMLLQVRYQCMTTLQDEFEESARTWKLVAELREADVGTPKANEFKLASQQEAREAAFCRARFQQRMLKRSSMRTFAMTK